jgi:hypothetical protein
VGEGDWEGQISAADVGECSAMCARWEIRCHTLIRKSAARWCATRNDGIVLGRQVNP